MVLRNVFVIHHSKIVCIYIVQCRMLLVSILVWRFYWCWLHRKNYITSWMGLHEMGKLSRKILVFLHLWASRHRCWYTLVAVWRTGPSYLSQYTLNIHCRRRRTCWNMKLQVSCRKKDSRITLYRAAVRAGNPLYSWEGFPHQHVQDYISNTSHT